MLFDPGFYELTEAGTVRAGKKRKRGEGKGKAKDTPPAILLHIDESLLQEAQNMLMRGFVNSGKLEGGLSWPSASHKLRNKLDKMYHDNLGVKPLLLDVTFFT